MRTQFLQTLIMVLIGSSLATVMTGEERRQLQNNLGVTQCDELEAFGRSGNYMASSPMPFCANHGQCRPDYGEHLDAPCICQPGYTGPHCEFLESQAPTCIIPCQNNGKCLVGAQTMEEYLDTSFIQRLPHEQQYCMCPEGFYGDICETPGTVCGLGFCYNGGTCVELEGTDEATGTDTITHHCDCTTAGDDKAAYAGDSCEFPSTTFCAEGIDHNGRHFCVNGGTCKGESHLGCNCLDGFVGPVCEFIDIDMAPEECTLECFNHGICRKGAKDLKILKNFGIHGRHLLDEKYNDNFEHCVCPGGYGGLQCEYKVDICPGQDHLCMNGGDCEPDVDAFGRFHFTCDCSLAKTKTSRFTGAFCEMESTEFCTLDQEKTARGKGQDAFCTNNGKCRDYVEHGQEHPGCDCPRGYTGDQCEYFGVDVRVAADDNKKRGGLVASFTIIITLLTFGILFSIYSRRKRAKREEMIAGVIAGTSSPPQLPGLESWAPNSEISDHEEEYADIDLREREDIDAASHPESQSGDSTLGGNSTASSLTIEEQPDGTVSLMKTNTRKPSHPIPASVNSLDSDLHIFKDSNDDDEDEGSEEGFITA